MKQRCVSLCVGESGQILRILFTVPKPNFQRYGILIYLVSLGTAEASIGGQSLEFKKSEFQRKSYGVPAIFQEV